MKRSQIALVILLFIVVIGFVFLSLRGQNCSLKPIPYNQTAWLQGNAQTRAQMIEDLMSFRVFKEGTDLNEVLGFLGEPDYQDDSEIIYFVDSSNCRVVSYEALNIAIEESQVKSISHVISE